MFRRQQEEALGKVRESLFQTKGGVDGLEQALQTFSLKKDGTVNQDQLLVALNRVGAGNLAMNDVNDFFQSIRQNRPDLEEDVEIDDILDVLK